VNRSTTLAIVCLFSLGCVHDVVLPDQTTEAVCGNGIVEAGEQCDVASPGCVGCQIAPDWTCTPFGCNQLCGDGVIGTGTTCESPRRDTDCDMTGYWAARETNYERDSILNSIQVSSQWYLFRLSQMNGEFSVAEMLDCGVHVTGSATVDYTQATQRGLVYGNRQDGGGSRPARHGTSIPAGAGCAVTIDRWYDVRGVFDGYLPVDFSTHPALGTLPALPAVSDPVNGTDFPQGAADVDGDGLPGAGFRVESIVSGVRNSAQRDWKEYATTAMSPVPAGSLTVVVPGAFDLQENVLRVTDCGTGCPLLASAAQAAQDIPSHMTLFFLGRTLGSARVAPVVVGPTRQNIDADLTTCAHVREVLPHDPTHP
jgi:hypothetical protein